MNAKRPDKFLAVKIEELRGCTKDLPVDLYLKISEDNFAHVFSKSTGLDYQRLVQYSQKGVRCLYLHAHEKEIFNRFLSQRVDHILSDPKVPNERKVAALLHITEQAVTEAFSTLALENSAAENTQKLIANYIDVMAQNPKTLTLILQLASHGNYLYYHSVAVSIVSILLAKATGIFNRTSIEAVGMGGLLHDVAMSQLSTTFMLSEDLAASEGLTPREFEEMKTHPAMGLKLLEGCEKISDEVRYIVYQHHEQPNGMGFPNGLHDQTIFFPAKIVSLVDAFVTLISRQNYREPLSVLDAFRLLERQKGKFDPNLVLLLKTLFQQEIENAAA